MGVSVDGGNVAQVLAPPHAGHKNKGAVQLAYLLEREREHAERLKQLELVVTIMGETVVTKEMVATKVAPAAKAVVNANK